MLPEPKAKLTFNQCEAEPFMFLNLIVTQVALETHKELTEIQSSTWTAPELPESNWLDYTRHTLLF